MSSPPIINFREFVHTLLLFHSPPPLYKVLKHTYLKLKGGHGGLHPKDEAFFKIIRCQVLLVGGFNYVSVQNVVFHIHGGGRACP